MRGKLEVLNFTEDMDDLELRVDVFLDQPCSVALTKILEKGGMGSDIRDTLGEYLSSLQSQYSGDNVLLPSKTTVNSRTVIADSKPSPPNKLSKKRIVKRNIKKNKKSSDDLLFYMSLLSIFGFSAVLVIKLANRL